MENKETLEEVAERIISDMGWVWENTESSARMVARHCAKSQERSYSEEEVYVLLIKHQSDYRSAVRNTSPLDWSFDIQSWFKKFKKK